MSESNQNQQPESSNLDDLIKQRQSSQKSTVLILGGAGGLLTFVMISWLFIIKGHDLTVAPDDATPATIQIDSGLGFVSGSTIYRFASDVTVNVSAPGFYEKPLELTDDSAASVTLELQPKPGIIHGQIDVPDDTTFSWLVDEALTATGKTTDIELAAGSYQLRVNSPYFQTWSQQVTVGRGEEITITPELTKVTGKMILNSTPQGARVSVNGNDAGVTPVVLTKQAGAYAVSLDLTDYEMINDDVVISNKQLTPVRNYQLALKKALLSLSIQPTGGLLLINGKEYNAANSNAGTHELPARQNLAVRYSKPGFQSFKADIRLNPSQQKSLAIQLDEQFGDVQFSSNVKSQVLVNGKPVGETPLSLSLPAKKHTLAFKRPGYRTVEREVLPQANKSSSVNVTLYTEFDARRRDGIPTVASQLGINLLPFEPVKFTMGSEKNEKGRVRNEHQITVDFSRKILVSSHEITEQQFRQFDASKNNANFPVTNISWLDAVKFCNWLSAKDGLIPFYQISNGRFAGYNQQSKGYRLLFEAEWEWLARLSKRVVPTKYPWGSMERIPDNVGNFGDSALKGSQIFYLKTYKDAFTGKAPVGSFELERAGVFDLSGNVSEWVNDFYSNALPDTSQVYRDYTGPATGESHVAKGGNYQTGKQKQLRGAYKIHGEQASETIGFRIARYQ